MGGYEGSRSPFEAVLLVTGVPIVEGVLGNSRFCEPSSELHIAEEFYRKSALADLLGIPEEDIYDNRLYRALDRLLEHKNVVQRHLKERLGELFTVTYDILLYDVTSTYFEGEETRNPQPQRGYSRGSRPDCKQVCIGLGVCPSIAIFAYVDIENDSDSFRIFSRIG